MYYCCNFFLIYQTINAYKKKTIQIKIIKIVYVYNCLKITLLKYVYLNFKPNLYRFKLVRNEKKIVNFK